MTFKLQSVDYAIGRYISAIIAVLMIKTLLHFCQREVPTIVYHNVLLLHNHYSMKRINDL